MSLDFVVREVRSDDAQALIALANTPGMFNLPNQIEDMEARIELSQKSFRGQMGAIERTKYVFVVEDLSAGKAVGTSMIAGQHGTELSPHYYFKVGNERRFSEALQTGFIHGTLTLHTQTDGPSELGALVVDETYRSHPKKIGKQVFFSRFLYLLAHPQRFRDQILAELLPPLNKRGHSPLWEAIGRRFTNLDYWEADALSAQNKDFIFDLFPQGKIYTTFLSAEARNAIGKVSKNTEPVFHLLKKIGFTYANEIDPFDGGPHLRANLAQLSFLSQLRRGQLTGYLGSNPLAGAQSGLLMSADLARPFRAIQIDLVAGAAGHGALELCDGFSLDEVSKRINLGADQRECLFLPLP